VGGTAASAVLAVPRATDCTADLFAAVHSGWSHFLLVGDRQHFLRISSCHVSSCTSVARSERGREARNAETARRAEGAALSAQLPSIAELRAETTNTLAAGAASDNHEVANATLTSFTSED
jgi:hypothetical protein